MGRTRAPERLTRSETGEMDLARAHLAALVGAADRVVATAGHDPDRADCGQAACRLGDVPDGQAWCRLAHRLVMLDVEVPAPPRDGGTTLDAALNDFRRALVSSLDAVRACRSIGHAEGRCWFRDRTGHDVCGEVLRLAHRAG
jgi:hypothetical protein